MKEVIESGGEQSSKLWCNPHSVLNVVGVVL